MGLCNGYIQRGDEAYRLKFYESAFMGYYKVFFLLRFIISEDRFNKNMEEVRSSVFRLVNLLHADHRCQTLQTHLKRQFQLYFEKTRDRSQKNLTNASSKYFTLIKIFILIHSFSNICKKKICLFMLKNTFKIQFKLTFI